MTEFYTQPSPLELLEREHPDLVRSSIVATAESCYCGACKTPLSSYEIEERDRCVNQECETGWIRVLTTVPNQELPMYSFRLAIISARGMLELKRKEKLGRTPAVTGLGKRSVAQVAVNSTFL